ncbi:glycosyltransferase [Salinimonas lutimaris]|uniref:glycosyltransferase n=1 Tax=Salinimonas lutimaris TaxID=914153 RepID=UPI0010C067C9|nr:glycosyltransferase [Salinimonas lutimaris]
MKILLLFPHPIKPTFEAIDKGDMPRERLYGFYELMKDPQYTIYDSDSRFEGTADKIAAKFRAYGANPVDHKTLAKIAKVDVIVVKDNVSSMVSLTARLLGKPVIYYDSLFPIPKWAIKRFFLKRCLASCQKVVGYNYQQVEDYERELGVPLLQKYKHLDFLLDETFYNKVYQQAPEPQERGYILSIGRDVGRDFKTLIEASKRTGHKVKLITLPYLLTGIELPDNVEVLQNISYEALFTLYKGASAVVVPLKHNLSYASGIRAIMESLVLSKPSVVSETPFVTNNCLDYPNLIPVPPEDVDAMEQAIEQVFADLDSPRDYQKSLPAYEKTHQEISQMLNEMVGHG